MGRKKELKPLERTELERIELAHNQGLAAALAAMTEDAVDDINTPTRTPSTIGRYSEVTAQSDSLHA